MKVIVTTTINSPTEAIEKFQALPNWELVVIGDKKTPKDYHLDRGIYVSPEEQEKYDKEFSDAIGWNCIQRRSFGLLWAHDMKADIMAEVDDDNISYEAGETPLCSSLTSLKRRLLGKTYVVTIRMPNQWGNTRYVVLCPKDCHLYHNNTPVNSFLKEYG